LEVGIENANDFFENLFSGEYMYIGDIVKTPLGSIGRIDGLHFVNNGKEIMASLDFPYSAYCIAGDFNAWHDIKTLTLLIDVNLFIREELARILLYNPS